MDGSIADTMSPALLNALHRVIDETEGKKGLVPSDFNRALLLGEIHLPQEAARAGSVDTVVPASAISVVVAQTRMGLSAIDFGAQAETNAWPHKQAIDGICWAIDLELVVSASGLHLALSDAVTDADPVPRCDGGILIHWPKFCECV